MTTLNPIEPKERLEILDVLRGFALLGIIFNNIFYFSGYAFIPFVELSQFPTAWLDEKIYYFIDIIVTAKFYTLFSTLFAVGFYLQFRKNQEDSIQFLQTYRRRLFILFLMGVIHSLFWFGDILLMYAMLGFILILFRNVKLKNLLLWAIFFLYLPVLIDVVILPLFQINAAAGGDAGKATLAHANYPDMTPEVVVNTFKYGNITELFLLNLHNLKFKWLSYIPSGRFILTLGIFLLGYYLSSIDFFAKKTKSTKLLIFSLIVGLPVTVAAHLLGGSLYQFPPTLSSIVYKTLLTTGQLFMCLFYVVSIFKLMQTSIGEQVLKYLKPMGRMALTNYILQTVICVIIFNNFGFNLICKTGLVYSLAIVLCVLIFQIIFSNMWLTYFRFGPLEWLWRSLTYKKRISIRYHNARKETILQELKSN